MKNRPSVALVLLLFALALQAETKPDKKGSSDHPLVDRYPESYITNYTFTEYDLYGLPTGPVASKKERPAMMDLEGRVTTIIYRAPNTLSTIQIMRNYERAFAEAGYKSIFSCDVSDCGEYFPRQWVKGGAREKQYLGLDVYNMSPRSDYRFWTGQLRQGDKEIYTTILIRKNTVVLDYLIEVVEVAALETGKVGINLDALGNDLKQTGRAVLDGVYFETDKATLKPASDETLGVVAEYLTANPAIRVFVVGHTDYDGSYDYNVDLSNRRAAAVVANLVERGIDKNRLQSVGIGPVSPAASNTEESGRSQNRRVELVLRK